MALLRPFLGFPLLALLATPAATTACQSGTGTGGATSESLRRFGSADELTAYLEKADEASATKYGGVGGSADAGVASSAGASAPEDSSDAPASSGASGSSSGPANETVTNDQEKGVDQGGTVKNMGDSLVAVRKGRLDAVSVATPGAPAQTDSLPVPPVDALNQSVWYDEMLVRGDRIYVIGYRYGVKIAGEPSSDAYGYGYGSGATEVSSFRLIGGKLARLDTLFLESNDYFSGSNYASRMIDGKLVFYMPHGAWRSVYDGTGKPAKKSLHIPRFFTSRGDGTFDRGQPIFAPTDVYVPIDVPTSPVFHTVVKCELPDTGGFTCQARSLLSSYGREHYVTPDAVFLWSMPRAYMFRFEDLGVAAHRTHAVPRDQFSFKAKDGVLHVVGSAWRDPDAPVAGSGDSADSPASSPTPASGSLVVDSLPIADFDVLGEQSLASKERAVGLVATSAYVAKNRFVGGALFLGATSYAYDAKKGDTSTHALLRFELGSGETTRLDLAGPVVRIEPLGDARAFAATQDATGLGLQTFGTSGPLSPQGTARLDGLAQGESRSHGFFFKPTANTSGGTFGLPVLNQEGGGGWYGSGLSNIGFWSVAESGALGAQGVISSAKEVGVCETSCTDWYGNTRPIFLGDRAFALMGSELAEITVAPAARVGAPAILTK